MNTDLCSFLEESNQIEGIVREVYEEELSLALRFLKLEKVRALDLESWIREAVSAFPRYQTGMNVQVGDHRPPSGGPHIQGMLEYLLTDLSSCSPWENHCRYEFLHPFTDGNGRSGRLLWLWQMEHFKGGAPLGFLHTAYYQALARRSPLTIPWERSRIRYQWGKTYQEEKC